MAKENNDKVTIDLFVEQPRRGRPRTNPLPRNEQLRINKRRQLQRDRQQGKKRLELKTDQQLHQQLTALADQLDCSRGELVEAVLKVTLAEDNDVMPAVVNLIKSGEN
ncbi:LexA regulated protein [Idiomarina seosinensis]|uniref:LexA regulated protein n=1 Tax=Idiomarina seosinensis TaxID=281739 RepID=A0A432ZIB6_9GAMM|nr:LexA regulated protein [Idiomarina seosinensis]RUO77757.1 LexA regulated protein [Idiomarina seosinensis]